ncbi:methyl-accepting chemotaxis sensory transducer [Clostridium sp. DL-VIII]|nr:methyl-accepting chemotaxis sensory transducer [Clostridium sp. DL-VIII]
MFMGYYSNNRLLKHNANYNHADNKGYHNLINYSLGGILMDIKLMAFKEGTNIKRSLKAKLMASYIAIALVSIVLIASLTYVNNRNILTNKVGELSKGTSAQTQLNIDNYLGEIENATSLIFANDNILIFNPLDNKTDQFQKEQVSKEISDYLLSISLMQNFTDFALVYEDGTTIGKTSETITNMHDMKALYTDLKNQVGGNKSKANWFTGKDGNYSKLYYAKQVNDKTMMLASIYTSELEGMLQREDDNSGIVLSLIDSQGIAIYSTDKNRIGAKVNDDIAKSIDGVNSKVFESGSNLITLNTCSNGWRLIDEIPKGYILHEIQTSGILTIVLTIVCIIISGIFGLFLARRIANPINNLVVKMKEAEEGDLTVKADVFGEDEIGMLSKSFNSMIGSIRNLIEETRSVSEIVVREAKDLKEISRQTSEIAEGVSKAMEGIAEGTVEQSNELDATLGIMENLASSINNIISNVSNVTIISNETKKVGDESLNIVKGLEVKTKNSNEVMGEITSNIEVLTESIKEIEKVIEMIQGISEETNLLSLNASIEAARAGESGKGFAVVAEEVKKLAEESRKSTESISKVIKDVYSKASTTKNLIDTSREVFKEQSEAVTFANNSFINIINSTEKITGEIGNIESLMNKINHQKDKTLESTNSIKYITENSSANTEEVLAATEEQTASAENLEERSMKLSETVKKLEDSLSIFKTN